MMRVGITAAAVGKGVAAVVGARGGCFDQGGRLDGHQAQELVAGLASGYGGVLAPHRDLVEEGKRVKVEDFRHCKVVQESFCNVF